LISIINSPIDAKKRLKKTCSRHQRELKEAIISASGAGKISQKDAPDVYAKR
jgi:hypothetical protein